MKKYYLTTTLFFSLLFSNYLDVQFASFSATSRDDADARWSCSKEVTDKQFEVLCIVCVVSGSAIMPYHDYCR